MVTVPSTMLALGSPVPAFALPDVVSGRTVRREDFANRPLLVMFICNHCPYVVHIRKELLATIRAYAGTALQVVAINANSTQTHPQDGPANMKQLATDEAWPFPFLFDESQETAKAFRAACTPEFYLFDETDALCYRGQFDGARPKNTVPVTGTDLRNAIDRVLAHQDPPAEQSPGIGCNIKWHPGTEPEYFSQPYRP
jgi:peroxiredoxin